MCYDLDGSADKFHRKQRGPGATSHRRLHCGIPHLQLYDSITSIAAQSPCVLDEVTRVRRMGNPTSILAW
jgi:hypothetical protein